MGTVAATLSLLDPPRCERTLDDVVTAAWKGLAHGRAVLCPVCRGDMKHDDRSAASDGGTCTACGSRLS